MNTIAHDSLVKYGIAISHHGEQIAYGKSGSGNTALIFIHCWSLDSSMAVSGLAFCLQPVSLK
ncbi:hypothetical protein A1QO_14795 [Vibrio genomosp. F10 str. ZF-129]|uniref:Uncharacterized protein n=1 Tax=Vibrio genomosp. F10 str. ZF-129 TaxID=1187848 RepID=A0A1E5B9K8_9VIBR|nr:hypothetical protein [Vibrio genomosp. F10]OEE30597.1 hypothetical protein A1QO_14795 [Vibrio genomosp. F10 str. ZF-129]OEE96603.1 hypothetical protein A1QM_16380 [Vibrio genomosp. F10 str. 9ZC157]